MEDYKTKTISSYNKYAKEYSEKFKQLMRGHKRHEFKKFISLLSGKNILDLGSGSGDHALYFSQNGLDVTCIDLSEEMIKLCKDKGLKAEIMDIENLNFEDESFDGIWAVTSLLHIPKSKIDNVVKKLNNILKPNGVLYACIKEGEGEIMVEDKYEGSQRLFVFWKESEFLNIFKNKFDLIELDKTSLGDTVFIKAFFKKHS